MTRSVIEKNYRVIVGMGKTGFSCAQFLSKAGLPFCVVDTRHNPPMLEQFKNTFPEVYMQTGNIDPELLAGAVEIVMSPGVALSEAFCDAARGKKIPFIGDIELFFREARAPIIAITGSNAKSTVTTLVGEMANASGIKTAVGGNLGTPALELLDDAAELYILELSSFQLELVNTFAAKVAVFLNVSEDHMDRYATLAEYVAAKRVIFDRCQVAVYNAEDKYTFPLADAQCKKIAFSINHSVPATFALLEKDGKTFLAKGDQALFDIAELKLAGMHNVSNCLAALAIGDAAGFSLPAMCEVLKEFHGLAHRCQLVRKIADVSYIDDSKGTNVGATLAAIEGLADKQKKNIVLIAGGEGKGADFSPLRAACARSVKACVLIGRDAKLIADALQDVTRLVYAVDMPSAVQTAAQLAARGDTVLLSPACASFDMFKNYEHRGDCFVAAVNALTQGAKS